MDNIVTDIYFKRSKEVAIKRNINPKVLYNVFIRSKKPFIFAGLELIRPIIEGVGGKIEYSLKDGDGVGEGSKTLLTYSGNFQDLVDIETHILADISAASTAAEAMYGIVRAAKGKSVLYFGARHRAAGADKAWSYGALKGGARNIASVPTDAKLGVKAVGTIPHALCLVCEDTLDVAQKFRETFPDMPLTVLIDTFGRELSDSIELVKYFGKDLYAVRIDTHGGRVCEGCHEYMDVSQFDDFNSRLLNKAEEVELPYKEIEKYVFNKGVTVESVYRLRKALDDAGGQHVKIVASSGFDEIKTEIFERMKAPVDVYGVGLGDVKNYLFATSDIVEVNDVARHKTGRYEEDFVDGRFLPVQ